MSSQSGGPGTVSAAGIYIVNQTPVAISGRNWDFVIGLKTADGLVVGDLVACFSATGLPAVGMLLAIVKSINLPGASAGGSQLGPPAANFPGVSIEVVGLNQSSIIGVASMAVGDIVIRAPATALLTIANALQVDVSDRAARLLGQVGFADCKLAAVSVALSASTDTVLIAGVALQTIRVLRVAVSTDALSAGGQLTFKDGSGGTTVGAANFSAIPVPPQSWSGPDAGRPLTVGNGLFVNPGSVTANLRGTIAYTQA